MKPFKLNKLDTRILANTQYLETKVSSKRLLEIINFLSTIIANFSTRSAILHNLTRQSVGGTDLPNALAMAMLPRTEMTGTRTTEEPSSQHMSKKSSVRLLTTVLKGGSCRGGSPDRTLPVTQNTLLSSTVQERIKIWKLINAIGLLSTIKQVFQDGTNC